jgi:hypothetical protein
MRVVKSENVEQRREIARIHQQLWANGYLWHALGNAAEWCQFTGPELVDWKKAKTTTTTVSIRGRKYAQKRKERRSKFNALIISHSWNAPYFVLIFIIYINELISIINLYHNLIFLLGNECESERDLIFKSMILPIGTFSNFILQLSILMQLIQFRKS